ncbi:MAG: hypothetical protein HY903_04280 [Deltaproteobacteria bacterium]|nr:hypothetical protein [Deltaproteobacteria bacterium]
MHRLRRQVLVFVQLFSAPTAMWATALTIAPVTHAWAKPAAAKGAKGKKTKKPSAKNDKAGTEEDSSPAPEAPAPPTAPPPAPEPVAPKPEDVPPPPAAPAPLPATESTPAAAPQPAPTMVAAAPVPAAPAPAAVKAAATATPPPPAAEPMPPKRKPKMVVLDLVSERGVEQGTVNLLNELLLTQFAQYSGYEVMGGSDVRAILTSEAQRQAISGCGDTSCLAELGGSLGADYVAVSNIGRIGDYYLLNVKILNVRTAEVVKRWSEQVEGLENKLMSAVNKSVAAIALEGAPKVPAAQLRADASADAGGSGATGKPGVLEFALWGGGALGVIVGALFGMKAKAAYAHTTDKTYVGGQNEISSGKSSQLMANVGFGLGGLSLVAGTLVFVLVGKSAPAVAVLDTATGNALAVTWGIDL